MRQIGLFCFLVLNADSQSACLSVTQIGAAANLKVFLLTWAPCFYVKALNLQVSKVTGAAFQSTNWNIQRTEEVNSIGPQFLEPFHAFLWFADNDHFLFLELMDAVNASFFDAVCTNFFSEAWGIAGQSLWELGFIKDSVDKFTDHGMFAGTD